MDIVKTDCELPNKMANLDIMETDETEESNESVSDDTLQTRMLRKRKSIIPDLTKSSNRRVSLKPRRYISVENASAKQIEALYLNKTIKTGSQTLETIYEEPKSGNSSSEAFIGGRKIKRLLNFQLANRYTKDKIKKRRAKIKKMLGNKTFMNRKKIPMHVFLKTIECLELDEPIIMENKEELKSDTLLPENVTSLDKITESST